MWKTVEAHSVSSTKNDTASRWLAACAMASWLVLFSTSVSPASAQLILVDGVVRGETSAANSDPNGLHPLLQRPGFKVPFDDRMLTALDDVNRYFEHQEWDKAFRRISEITDDQITGMVPTDEGFLIPAKERIWSLLAHLPAEGRDAFRVYYNGPAEKLMETVGEVSLVDPSSQIESATKIYRQYFLSSRGDDAANLLGDLAFEQGRFLEADGYWRSILEFHPQCEISESQLWLKRAAALARAGRRTEFDALLVQIGNRFDGEPIELGGRSRPFSEYLGELSATVGEHSVDVAENASRSAVAPASDVPPAWRMQFADDKHLAELMQNMRNQGWGANSMNLDTYVPPIALDEQRLYCQWFGIVFALDLKTGKLLYRTHPFNKLTPQAMQQLMYRMDPGRYRLAIEGGQLIAMGVPPEEMEQWNANSRIWAMDPATGKSKWSSAQESKLQQYSFTGQLLVRGETLLAMGHQQGGGDLMLIGINVQDGKFLWEARLGTMQTTQNMYGQQLAPSPLIYADGDLLYVLTNNGAMLCFDINQKQVKWVFCCLSPAGLDQVPYYRQSVTRAHRLHSAGSLYQRNRVLYFKEARGRMMYRFDLETQTLIWQRPIEEEAMIVGIDDRFVYVLSDELEAIDCESRKLVWSVALPIEGGGLSCVVGDDRVLVQTSRGIYELSKDNGDPLRIFRGYDRSSMGGYLTERNGLLINVSNQALTAYPFAGDPSETAVSESE
ncbi:MAG: PQQ-binding-like beta-propeller repeat protein [Planctomycetaceae bacterium]